MDDELSSKLKVIMDEHKRNQLCSELEHLVSKFHENKIKPKLDMLDKNHPEYKNECAEIRKEYYVKFEHKLNSARGNNKQAQWFVKNYGLTHIEFYGLECVRSEISNPIDVRITPQKLQLLFPNGDPRREIVEKIAVMTNCFYDS